MSCRKMEVLIYQFAELSLSEKEIVEGHAQTCIACKTLLEQVSRQHNLIRQAATIPIEVRNAAQLTHKIMSAIQQQSKPSWWSSLFENHNIFVPRMAAVLASALLVIFFLFEFFQEGVPQTSYSKNYSGTSTLNTNQFLNMQWKRREVTTASVSFYNCLKRDDCVFKNIKTNQTNEKI